MALDHTDVVSRLVVMDGVPHDPATVRAMVEDYRAGLGIDREHVEADRRAGRTVRCPTLFLWSTGDDVEDLYGDPLTVWQPWVDDLRGAAIESGHHMAEEIPQRLPAALPRDHVRPPHSWRHAGRADRQHVQEGCGRRRA
jgi:hypothetical protein